MAKVEATNMECPSCGGQLQISQDGTIAKCRFCGGTQVLQQATAQFDRLNDLPNASLHIRHREAVHTLDQVRSTISEEFGRDPIAFRTPDALDMKIEGGYVPIWFADATIHCSWHGKWAETRTVTRYRTVRKERTVTKVRANGEPYSTTETYEEQEPYNDTETVWHPQSGNHNFSARFVLPANEGFGMENLFLPREVDPGTTRTGLPFPNRDQIILHPALVTQREAWEKNRCLARINDDAHAECMQMTDQLDRVAPKVEAYDFQLVFLPFARVTYSANGREYCHVFDLTNGCYTGDMVALDRSAVDIESLASEARQAITQQQEIDKRIEEGRAEIARKRREIFSSVRKWGWAFMLPGVLFFVAGGNNNSVLWFLFWLTLLGVGIKFLLAKKTATAQAQAVQEQIEATLPKETPWQSFVTQRRRDLLRLRRVLSDHTTKASELTPEEADKHFAWMQDLRELEAQESKEAIEEAEDMARSLCEKPSAEAGG